MWWLFYGELIQVDGLFYDWFENWGFRCILIVFIDDVISVLMVLCFVFVEIIWVYMEIFWGYFNDYGVLFVFYFDRYSIFRVNNLEWEGELI